MLCARYWSDADTCPSVLLGVNSAGFWGESGTELVRICAAGLQSACSLITSYWFIHAAFFCSASHKYLLKEIPTQCKKHKVTSQAEHATSKSQTRSLWCDVWRADYLKAALSGLFSPAFCLLCAETGGRSAGWETHILFTKWRCKGFWVWLTEETESWSKTRITGSVPDVRKAHSKIPF